MSKKPNIAVIGLGSMGWGAAVSLLREGFPTSGADLRPEVLEAFDTQGGQACTSVAQAVQSAQIVFVFVVNAAQTEEILFGANGAIKSAQPGTLFILCVTMAPSDAISLATRIEDSGMLAIDAPVSGGASKALTGEMSIMASGSSSAFDLAEQAINAISSKVFRLGETPGMGSQVKMINQLLAGVHIAATAEAMTLGAKVGIDLETLYEVIKDCAGNSWMFENRGAHILTGDYSPRSAVDIFVKDLNIVTSEAQKAECPTPLSASALNLFKEASAQGLGREDDAAVAKVLAKKAKVILPSSSSVKE